MKRKVRVDLIAVYRYLTEGVEKKADSSWRCAVDEAMKTSWNMENSHPTHGLLDFFKFYHEGNQILDKLVEKGCRISTLGDI